MNSRRFVLGFLLAQVLLFAALMTLVSQGRMLFMNAEYPMWKAKETLLAKVTPRSVVLLGDSRAMAAFIPDEIGPDFVNLALGGTTVIEGYFLLQAALETATPAKVVLSYAPYHFALADSFWERSAKFDKAWLGVAQLEQILADARELGDNDAIGGYLGHPPNELPFALRWNLPTVYKGDLVPPPPPNRPASNRAMLAATLAARGHHLFGEGVGYSGLPDEALGKPFAASPLIDLYLRKTIELCQARGIPVVLAGTPLPQGVRAKLESTGYPAMFDRYIDRIGHAAGPDGAHITYYPDQEFGDPNHLNQAGATRFSRQMRAAL